MKIGSKVLYRNREYTVVSFLGSIGVYIENSFGEVRCVVKKYVEELRGGI